MIHTLADLPFGSDAVLDDLALSADDAARLMELGFLPGSVVHAVRAAPSGDPCVFRVDGVDIALRRESARLLRLRAET
ncbi:MAG TPA: FeoA domain-containing protein [Gemmatimonadales bacterium]|nr:FeoA domain-containing protein [Gemmatimonadales bacterium]